MAKTTTAIRFDQQEREWIQAYADFLGISFSQFIRRAALEKLEDALDTQDYMQALKEDDGTRYTMDEIMREVMEDE